MALSQKNIMSEVENVQIELDKPLFGWLMMDDHPGYLDGGTGLQDAINHAHLSADRAQRPVVVTGPLLVVYPGGGTKGVKFPREDEE